MAAPVNVTKDAVKAVNAPKEMIVYAPQKTRHHRVTDITRGYCHKLHDKWQTITPGDRALSASRQG